MITHSALGCLLQDGQIKEVEQVTERLTEKTDEGIWVKESHGDNVMKTLYQCHGAEPLPNYSNCDEGYCGMEKLVEYETAEEEGRLVVLPCKVGNTVYCVLYTLAFGEIGDKAEKHYFIRKTSFEYGMIDDLNETVFLTREEAEKALEEIKSKQWLNV